jgi:AcrR family transcriptional regulator
MTMAGTAKTSRSASNHRYSARMPTAPRAAGKPQRRTQAERRQEAERRVLDAAIQLVAEGGVNGATFARVAEVSGYSRGIVTHYFATKTAMLERMVIEIQGRFTATLPPDIQAGSGLETLMTFTQHYLDGLSGHITTTRAFAVLWTDAATHAPELRPALIERHRFARDVLARAVRRGIRDGSIRADVDAKVFAAAHLVWLRGIAIEHLLDARGFRLKAVEPEILASVRARLAA